VKDWRRSEVILSGPSRPASMPSRPDRPASKSFRLASGRFSEVVIISKVTRNCNVLECGNATGPWKIRKMPF